MVISAPPKKEAVEEKKEEDNTADLAKLKKSDVSMSYVAFKKE